MRTRGRASIGERSAAALVIDLALGDVAAVVLAAGTAIWFAWFWFAVPWLRRRSCWSASPWTSRDSLLNGAIPYIMTSKLNKEVCQRVGGAAKRQILYLGAACRPLRAATAGSSYCY